MGIEKIDKNFAIKRPITSKGKTTYAIPSPYFSLHGVYYDEKAQGFVRLDPEFAYSVSNGCGWLSRHTAGGRLRFATDSATFEIAVSYREFGAMPHMPLTGSSGFSLFEESAQGETHIANLTPLFTDTQGFKAVANLPNATRGKMREYILYFPLYNNVDTLSISLDEGACVQRGRPYRDVLPILYYGSSITQGGCASRPDNAYQALICKRNKIDYINLGFSGSGKAEPKMVDYLATIDCSLFVCDYDWNAETAEYLAATHYPLYERYRKARPNTPILFVSKPDLQRDPEGKERVEIIRATYQKAKKQGDKKVYFLSGERFYNGRACWNFAVDGCHPTDYGFALMADKIYKKMLTIDEKFKGE